MQGRLTTRGCLPAAGVVQGRVELALEAALRVPLGAAVAPEDQPFDGQGRHGSGSHRPAVSPSAGAASSVEEFSAAPSPAEGAGRELSENGMVGQSFQRRSSA